MINHLICAQGYHGEEKQLVLSRSNSTLVCHFGNVVDDVAMEISHVIRGADHFSRANSLFSSSRRLVHRYRNSRYSPLIVKTNLSGKDESAR
jgi:glutamyl-tRNA synthetase